MEKVIAESLDTVHTHTHTHTHTVYLVNKEKEIIYKYKKIVIEA